MDEGKIFRSAERNLDNPRSERILEVATGDQVVAEIRRNPSAQIQVGLAAMALVHAFRQFKSEHYDMVSFCMDPDFSLAWDILVSQQAKIERFGKGAHPMSEKQIAVVERAIIEARAQARAAQAR